MIFLHIEISSRPIISIWKMNINDEKERDCRRCRFSFQPSEVKTTATRHGQRYVYQNVNTSPKQTPWHLLPCLVSQTLTLTPTLALTLLLLQCCSPQRWLPLSLSTTPLARLYNRTSHYSLVSLSSDDKRKLTLTPNPNLNPNPNPNPNPIALAIPSPSTISFHFVTDEKRG